MANKRFEKQEAAVAAFVNALENAGMQSAYDNVLDSNNNPLDLPRYFRGYVDKNLATDALFVRFIVDDNEIPYSADNFDFLQTIEIGGEVYTYNGYNDSDYIDLCLAIESQMQSNEIDFKWLGEGTDASFDIDNPIKLKRFTATINKI